MGLPGRGKIARREVRERDWYFRPVARECSLVSEMDWDVLNFLPFKEVKWLSRVRLFATPWTGSSIHGIFQTRILEWVAVSFSRVCSRPREWTRVFRIVGRLYRLSHRGICLFSPFFSRKELTKRVRMFTPRLAYAPAATEVKKQTLHVLSTEFFQVSWDLPRHRQDFFPHSVWGRQKANQRERERESTNKILKIRLYI